MRRDALYLSEILECAEAVRAYIGGVDEAEFMSVAMVRDAVLMRLTVIGESCGMVSKELRERFPDVPWQRIKDFRNVAVHDYSGVDWEAVWAFAAARTPELAARIAEILQEIDRAE